VVVTTILTPPLLRYINHLKKRAEERHPQNPESSQAHE
jgi:hypothetical protein